MKALVHVTLKPDVLDPQGKAIRNACASLGYEGIESVRQPQFRKIVGVNRGGNQALAFLSNLMLD